MSIIKLTSRRQSQRLLPYFSTTAAGLNPNVIAGVRAAWLMDETSGTTVFDSSSSALNSTSQVSTSIVTGKYGNARSFGGSSAVVFPSTPLPAGANDPFSVVMWVYPTTLPGNGAGQVIARFGHTSGQVLSVFYNTGGVTYAYFCFRNNAQLGFAATGLATNAWYNYVFTFNGGSKGSASSYGIYQNGVALVQSASFGNAGGSATDTALGSDGGNVGGLIGNMDTAVIFNGVLTQTHATWIATATSVSIDSVTNSMLVTN